MRRLGRQRIEQAPLYYLFNLDAHVPNNHLLRCGITNADTVIHRASQHDCERCPLKAQDCLNIPLRKITRHVNESAREVARQIAKAPAYVR